MKRMNSLLNGIIIVLCLLSSFSSYAQMCDLTNGTIKHNDAERPCIIVHFEQSSKEVEEGWEKYLKQYKIKMNGAGFLGMGNLKVAEEVIFEQISPKNMDFYTHIEEKEGGTELVVFAAFGYDMYINETDTPEDYKKLKQIIGEFMKVYLPPYYENKIEKTEKEVKKLTQKGEKLEKILSKNAKKIEKLENEIKDAKEEGIANEESLKTAETNLADQKKKWDAILKQLSKL